MKRGGREKMRKWEKWRRGRKGCIREMSTDFEERRHKRGRRELVYGEGKKGKESKGWEVEIKCGRGKMTWEGDNDMEKRGRAN